MGMHVNYYPVKYFAMKFLPGFWMVSWLPGAETAVHSFNSFSNGGTPAQGSRKSYSYKSRVIQYCAIGTIYTYYQGGKGETRHSTSQIVVDINHVVKFIIIYIFYLLVYVRGSVLLGPLLSPLSLLPPCGKGVLRPGGTLFINLKFLKCWCFITSSLGVMRYIQCQCSCAEEYTYVHAMARSRKNWFICRRSEVEALVRVYKWLKVGLWMLMKGIVLVMLINLFDVRQWCRAIAGD